MKRAYVFGAILLAITLAVLACNLPANPNRIQKYLSGTQTAEAGLQIPTAETAAVEPTDNFPEPPPVSSRCDLFTGLELPVYLLDVYPNSSSLMIYVEFPAGVIGLEDGTDDGAPWEYSATLGDVQSRWCAVFEGADYAGRLYCMFPLPKEYHNAAKPLSVQVNLCQKPIVSIPRQSVVVQDLPAAASSGSSNGGDESGPDILTIQGFYLELTNICGEEPWLIGVCRDDWAEWCACMGGVWEVDERMDFCDCILP
ncbi:MAG: hypothetical protein JW757_12910 [Anaerolineales bacterium]|nr:hypothetical protein [Anaerolineales bacterium]